jgi:hypothetical protein
MDKLVFFEEDSGRNPARFAWVTRLHTLGPTGTNCERAAVTWARYRSLSPTLLLHRSLEDAANEVVGNDGAALVSAIAYPQLHSLIYSHLRDFQLIDIFIMNTDEMVLAARSASNPAICATHPAPEKLIPAEVARVYASSNSDAAARCANGEVDGCVTTLCCAKYHNLTLVQNFGKVAMGFAIHGRLCD